MIIHLAEERVDPSSSTDEHSDELGMDIQDGATSSRPINLADLELGEQLRVLDKEADILHPQTAKTQRRRRSQI